jgi:hypothetical protein
VGGRRLGRRGALGLGLALGAGAVAACSGEDARPGGSGAASPAPAPSPGLGRLLWSADLTGARDAAEAGYGAVLGAPSAAAVPVVRRPMLGRALALSLGPDDALVEVAPGADAGLSVGDEVYVRSDVVLDPGVVAGAFVLSRVVAADGSVPAAVEVRDGDLWARLGGPAYDVRLDRVSPGVAYSLVCRLAVGASAAACSVEVWLDTEQVLADRAPREGLAGGRWGGATLARAEPGRPGTAVTAYQAAHRIGTSYLAVIS